MRHLLWLAILLPTFVFAQEGIPEVLMELEDQTVILTDIEAEISVQTPILSDIETAVEAHTPILNEIDSSIDALDLTLLGIKANTAPFIEALYQAGGCSRMVRMDSTHLFFESNGGVKMNNGSADYLVFDPNDEDLSIQFILDVFNELNRTNFTLLDAEVSPGVHDCELLNELMIS